MFPVIAAIPCMLGVATKYSCSTKSSGILASCSHGVAAFSVSSRVVESTAVSS